MFIAAGTYGYHLAFKAGNGYIIALNPVVTVHTTCFNIQQVNFANTVHCVFRMIRRTISINQSILVMDTDCVSFAPRTQLLNILCAVFCFREVFCALSRSWEQVLS